MEVFLHRANSKAEQLRATSLGIGVEVDIRTHNYNPHLSHDVIDCYDIKNGEAMRLGAMFSNLRDDTPVLLDFKEIDIIDIVKEEIHQPELLDRCLAIDLFVPDMYYAQKQKLYTLARRSRYEDVASWCAINGDPKYDAGYWLDFVHDIRGLTELDFLTPGYLVSPELHGKPLTDAYINKTIELKYAAVCTDYPERWLEAIQR